MKAGNKSLQNLTEKTGTAEWLFALKKINLSDFAKFDKTEIPKLTKYINEQINTLKGIDHDEFMERFIVILEDDVRNQRWENNHNLITWAISTLMQESGYMPTSGAIANKTELSRQTVNKHLKEFASHPIYLEHIERFKFMASKVLTKVFQNAIDGDIGAAKLYFNVLGFMNNGQAQNNTLIQNQNNYIQINGMVLSQENIKHLNPEQLNTIETILKTALPQPAIAIG